MRPPEAWLSDAGFSSARRCALALGPVFAEVAELERALVERGAQTVSGLASRRALISPASWRWLMLEAALSRQRAPETLRFKHSLPLIRRKLPRQRRRSPRWLALIKAAANGRLASPKGLVESRVVKRRPSNIRRARAMKL